MLLPPMAYFIVLFREIIYHSETIRQALFEYLDKKDDTIIRRQPPEVQKVLNKIIKEIE